MARRYVTVTVAEAPAVRAALLQRLAANLGRQYRSGAMEDDPPGTFTTTRAVEERVSRDGLTVSFVVDDRDENPVVLRNPRSRVEVLRMEDVAGMTVRGVDIPAAQTRPENDFPEPPDDPF